MILPNGKEIKLYNPNLLLNSDYRNPINQRGKAIYTVSGWGKRHTIDRWYISSSDVNSLVVNEDGITLSVENSTLHFKQAFENHLELGKYTMQVEVSNIDKNVEMYYSFEDDTSSGLIKLVNGSNIFTINAEKKIKGVGLRLSGQSSISLKWIKLEAGELATPFIPRSYGEELLLCQRYYSIGYICMMIINSWANPYRYTVPMRGVPTISISKQKSGTTGGDVIDDTRVRVSSVTNSMVEFIQTSYDGILWFRCVLEQDAEIF